MTSRPVIAAVEEAEDGEDLIITVVLSWGEDRFEGAAVGNADPRHRARLAGEAALRAVERIAGDRLQLQLASIATADLGPARVALAELRSHGGTETLVGSALLGDERPAVVAARAVMDAINRRLGLIL